MILDDMSNKGDVFFGDTDPNTDYIGEDMNEKKNNKKIQLPETPEPEIVNESFKLDKIAKVYPEEDCEHKPRTSVIQILNDLQMCIDMIKSKSEDDHDTTIDINIKVKSTLINKKIRFKGRL